MARLQRADQRLVQDAAACSLWWTEAPPMEGERIGCIGHYAAETQTAGEAMIRDALDILRANGCTLAVGPMDGNTWRSYRFVTDPGERPPFFLEPTNPAHYPLAFEACGFETMASYSSSILDQEGLDEMAAIRKRAESRGVSFRSLDPDRFEEELKVLHEISLASFTDNFLYTPISWEEFSMMYAQVQVHLQSDLVLIAEHEGKGVAFAFGILDLLEKMRGEPSPNLVTKTVAVDPEWRRFGLGAYLVQLCQINAKSRYDCRQSVHALQHETNSSLKITGRGKGQRIREYTLYSRRLA